MDHSAFTEIALIMAVALAVSVVMKFFKQPLIIGYILTGIIVGPSLFDLVHSNDTIDVFANLGISLLLFIIGLGLNPRVIKEVGKVAIITGVSQVFITSVLGFFIAKTLGFDNSNSLFLGVALAFSSTIIVLKLISDRKEQTRLYAKIAIGFLLVQDVFATFALLFASAISESGGITASELFRLFALGTIIASLIAIIAIKVLPKFTKFISGSQEFLFLFAIGWGFGVAALFAEIGFSIEVGALIAGVALASLPYAQEVASRLRPLRDFFIVLFFIAMGSHLGIDNISAVLPQALIFSCLVLIGNPIIVISAMGILGYTKKTSFKAGLAVAQISEFSLVFVLLGQKGGLVNDETVALVTLIALITIAISSYMIIYSDKMYNALEKYLKLFERKKTHSDRESAHKYDMILFGYKGGGPEFLKVFKSIGKKYVVIDYDPETIDKLEHDKAHYLYGDATDIEFLEELDLNNSKLIISTITDHPTNTFLVKYVIKENPHLVLICHSDNASEASELYDLGATYVMMPHYLGSEKIGNFIRRNGFKKTEFKKFREKHLEYLQSHHD